MYLVKKISDETIRHFGTCTFMFWNRNQYYVKYYIFSCKIENQLKFGVAFDSILSVLCRYRFWIHTSKGIISLLCFVFNHEIQTGIDNDFKGGTWQRQGIDILLFVARLSVLFLSIHFIKHPRRGKSDLYAIWCNESFFM